MAECVAVDPSDLITRAERLRSLGLAVAPTADDANHLIDELTSIGSSAYARAGERFASSWALSLTVLAATLESIGTQLEEAAVTYAIFEEMLAEALN